MLRWQSLSSVYKNIIKSYGHGLYLIESHDEVAPYFDFLKKKMVQGTQLAQQIHTILAVFEKIHLLLTLLLWRRHVDYAYINGSQLTKMNKSIPDMSLS